MEEITAPPPKDWLHVDWSDKTLAIADPYLVWASVVRGEGVRPVRFAKGRTDWVQVLVEYEYQDSSKTTVPGYTTRTWTSDYLKQAITGNWLPKDLKSLGAKITRIELATAFDTPDADPNDDDSSFASAVRAGTKCADTVLAVIDFGCPLLHAAYVDESLEKKSRVKYLWDQGAMYSNKGGTQHAAAGTSLDIEKAPALSKFLNSTLKYTAASDNTSQFVTHIKKALRDFQVSKDGKTLFGGANESPLAYRLNVVPLPGQLWAIAGSVTQSSAGGKGGDYWDPPSSPLDGSAGKTDRRFTYGRELRPAGIKSFMGATQNRTAQDRYQQLHYSTMKRVTSHGANILCVAAGWPDLLAHAPTDARDAAAEADIVFVQLPARTVADTNGNSLGAHVFSALQYISSRTEPSAKVVANLSYGSYAGPHDGSSLIEKAINKFVQDENAVRSDANGSFDLVIAAGNGYQSASHARVKLDQGNPRSSIPFQVMPDDTTWTFIEVWYRKSSDVTVAVQPPDSSTALSAVGPNSVKRFGDSDEPTCVIVHAENASSIGQVVNSMALLAIAPTRRMSGAKMAEAPYGVWKLVLNYAGQGQVQVDAWIERDEPILEPTFPKRQATFVVDPQPFAQRDDDYPRISHATKEATVNSIATGYVRNENIHVVGATVASSGHYSDYTPAGDVGSGNCPAPNALAAADENDVLYGRLVYGNYDSVVVRRSGTSIAAAMYSRLLLNRPNNPRPLVPTPSAGSALRQAPPPPSQSKRQVGNATLQNARGTKTP